MKSKKIRFNVLDLIVIFGFILIIVSAVLRGIAVNKFENNNTIEEVVITLRLVDADEVVFDDIQKGDYIFSNELLEEKSVGIVSKKMKHSLSQRDEEDGTEDSELIEYEFQIITDCLRSSKGFYSINSKLIVPGMNFSADNGYVGFDCEVVSVKTAD